MSLQDEVVTANSDSFWEVDSFKTTVKRTEDGLQMCGELMKLIQERADIEKEYAKRLKGWAKKWSDSFEKGPEYGTNKATWKKALDEADRMGDVHLSIKDHLLNDVQAEVKEWRNDNYKKQMVGGCKEAKTFEDDFKKAQKPWSKRLAKVLKCKKDYHLACKLEKTASNQENNARNSSEVSADQLKKFHEKVEKCRKDAEVTKVRYEQALTELNAYNAKYVEDMTEVYNRTQEFEERRLKFFKKVLYDLDACLDLTQNKSIAEIYTQFKKNISELDSAEDLKWWSLHHGVDMPMAWPTFEDYTPELLDISHKKCADVPAGSSVTLRKISTAKYREEFGSSGAAAAATPEYLTEFHSISRKEKTKSAYISGVGDGVMLTLVQKSDPLTVSTNSRTPPLPATLNSSSALNERANDCRPTSALVQSQNPFGEDDWEEYDNTALQDDCHVGATSTPATGVQVKALFSYEGQEGDELSFEAGDVFIKLRDRDDQGWCTGCKDGRIGLFPENYVQVIGPLGGAGSEKL